ncbi:threonine/homoserine/homoserine lactone efflux protein [Desulfobaculum xiamenense]|uniref:Threonine/homoserine/homoserine lactone efflux protein n=1 Tax=Desulfobaculum xiamenense TaxID=995050 RepID=A0A846QQE1_9BACT|nr:LysE family translocator [Desulfobaculum xiamenense]NJB67615.1 threonine/homoserine/homoserine lactone efflux protein [Desulfobaculum xiamenense]
MLFGIENFFVFMAAGILLNVTPGPDMFYVATRSAGQGRAAGVASALAIACGGVVHTMAASLGLSAVLAHSALAFDIVRWAGAVYLVWMGLRLILSRPEADAHKRLPDAPVGKIFRQGLVVAIFNPKVALFFLSFLPQFANPASADFAVQVLVLGLTFCATGLAVMTTIALCFGCVNAWASGRPGLRRFQTRATGGVFVTMGLCLGLAER